ncbi:hypothetical protein RN001_008126 [Aquatica leii]|uniref:HCLS1-associated protein X-1 n=1 Tax=Aquatica leii TaxID=1421715 RepID=A0AAN7Q4W9_9COLE|nr:hypothetical protein RN001_008126 [Aquatica leii]
MDFYSKLKRFLGIPLHNYNNDNNNNSLDTRDHRDQFSVRPTDDYEQFGFNVFSNPLEMHKYFEQQMNEMMKSFGIFNSDAPFFDNDESFFGGFKETSPFFNFGFSQLPAERDIHRAPDGNLRDNFLKPGYEEPVNKKSIKTDSDLDEQYRSGDFSRTLVPKQQTPTQTFSYGKSVVSKTITNSDGLIETHKTIQDQNGNREETVTRKRGDKEYTVITRIDKNGVKEITENLVNIDESEKDTFYKNNTPGLIIDKNQQNLEESLFSKFFRR